MAQPTKNPPVKAAVDDLDAIPMKKTNPMMALAIGGALVLVVGVIAVTSMKKKDNKVDAAAATSAVSTATMTPEELKRHIELTRKAMEVNEADEAKKKEAEAAKAAAAAAEEAAKAQPAGGGAAPPAGGGTPAPVAKAGGDEPPKPKVPTKVQKKTMSDLDKMGSDITGGLK